MGHWKDKGVGVSLLRGTSQGQVVLDERDGTMGGYIVGHWDDRQDANVLAKALHASFALTDGPPKPRPPAPAPLSKEERRAIEEILTRRVNHGI